MVVVTGSSRGMGVEICKKFLKEGYRVTGLDVSDINSELVEYYDCGMYIHHHCDVSIKNNLPDISNVHILVNNAGVQNTGHDIDINLKGVINCTEKYGLQPQICAILNQAASAAWSGADFPEYVASKGGVIAYTRWCAKEVAKYGAVCNSLSFGGVKTELNYPVIHDPTYWDQIMMMTPLKKWATEREAADWVYFMTVVNKSVTGQDIIIDNGEILNSHFVWPE